MAPAGNRDGSFEIGHWDEEELRELYLDGKLEGEWSCESELSVSSIFTSHPRAGSDNLDLIFHPQRTTRNARNIGSSNFFSFSSIKSRR